MNYEIDAFWFYKRENKKERVFFCQIMNYGGKFYKKKVPKLSGLYNKEMFDYLLLSLILAFLPVSCLK